MVNAETPRFIPARLLNTTVGPAVAYQPLIKVVAMKTKIDLRKKMVTNA